MTANQQETRADRVARLVRLANESPAEFCELLGWVMADEDIGTIPIDRKTLAALYPGEEMRLASNQ